MARFDYNSILCYVRGLWLRVAKFSISKPQRTGQGGERKKEKGEQCAVRREKTVFTGYTDGWPNYRYEGDLPRQ